VNGSQCNFQDGLSWITGSQIRDMANELKFCYTLYFPVSSVSFSCFFLSPLIPLLLRHVSSFSRCPSPIFAYLPPSYPAFPSPLFFSSPHLLSILSSSTLFSKLGKHFALMRGMRKSSPFSRMFYATYEVLRKNLRIS